MSDIRELLENSQNILDTREMHAWKLGIVEQLHHMTDEVLVELLRVVITSVAVRMAGSQDCTFASLEVHERAIIDTLDCLKRSVSNEFRG